MKTIYWLYVPANIFAEDQFHSGKAFVAADVTGGSWILSSEVGFPAVDMD